VGLFKPNVKKLKEKRDVQKLIEALKHKDRHVRAKTAEALGIIRDERAVEIIIQTLSDEDEIVRENAAKALGMIGGIEAIDPLTKLLGDQFWKVAWAAADALDKLGWVPEDDAWRIWLLICQRKWQEVASLGEPAIRHLTLALNQFKWITLFMAANIALAEKSFQAAVDIIRHDFRDGSSFLDFRMGAAEALASMDAIEAIEQAFSQEMSTFKFDTAMALGRSRNSRVMDVLRRRINEGDMAVISGAYKLVIRLGYPATEEFLAKTLDFVSWDEFGGPAARGAGMAWRLVMAEDFLNCSNPKLENAALQWAAKHGLNIVKKVGHAGPKWGEGIKS